MRLDDEMRNSRFEGKHLPTESDMLVEVGRRSTLVTENRTGSRGFNGGAALSIEGGTGQETRLCMRT